MNGDAKEAGHTSSGPVPASALTCDPYPGREAGWRVVVHVHAWQQGPRQVAQEIMICFRLGFPTKLDSDPLEMLTLTAKALPPEPLTLSHVGTHPDQRPHWVPAECLPPHAIWGGCTWSLWGLQLLSSWVKWPFLHRAHRWQQLQPATHQLHQEGDLGKSRVLRRRGWASRG